MKPYSGDTAQTLAPSIRTCGRERASFGRVLHVATSLFVALLVLLPGVAPARRVGDGKSDKGLTDPNRVLVLDGSNIHNVGELQMHVGNWGFSLGGEAYQISAGRRRRK